MKFISEKNDISDSDDLINLIVRAYNHGKEEINQISSIKNVSSIHLVEGLRKTFFTKAKWHKDKPVFEDIIL